MLHQDGISLAAFLDGRHLLQCIAEAIKIEARRHDVTELEAEADLASEVPPQIELKLRILEYEAADLPEQVVLVAVVGNDECERVLFDPAPRRLIRRPRKMMLSKRLCRHFQSAL
jgi:hypothetical protein